MLHLFEENSQIETVEEKFKILWMDTHITSTVMMMPDGGIIAIITVFILVQGVSVEEHYEVFNLQV